MDLQYLIPFIGQIDRHVAADDATGVHYTAKRIIGELVRFTPQDFQKESQADFVLVKSELDRWARSILGAPFKENWPVIKEAFLNLIENFIDPDSKPANVPLTRDRDIMKLLLLQVRDGKEPSALKLYPEQLVVYNAALLIKGEFVEGDAIQDSTGKYVSAVMTNLTNKGHDLLEDIMAANTRIPPEITESLGRFRKDHPDAGRAAFIMMQFGESKAHPEIVAAIREAFRPFNIQALRADDKQYHDDLLPNVLTYVFGCGMGIAVFERIEQDAFNPNVAFEVGYMLALGKPVCMLKDKTLATLHTDLIGKLYKDFDPLGPKETIPPQVWKWVSDKGLR